MPGDKWYRDGLRFECRQCGTCCGGAPGYVWATREEIRRISMALGRTDGWLDKQHLRRVGLRYSLTERPGGDCVFLARGDGGAGCLIYEVRPLQCRTWPFWNEVLQSGDTWEATAGKCPGMNFGRRYSYSEIEEIRAQKE